MRRRLQRRCCYRYRGAPYWLLLRLLLLRLLGRELDHVVDAQHGDGRLRRELDHLDLGERGLDDARGEVVLDLAWLGFRVRVRVRLFWILPGMVGAGAGSGSGFGFESGFGFGEAQAQGAVVLHLA